MSVDTAEFTIVTGLSGAGKTQAMKALEDLGFFCIDNLPPLLLPQLVELREGTDTEDRRFAVAIDVRGQEYFRHLSEALDWLQSSVCSHQILFLECSDAVLVRRFSETRRRHPLAQNGNLYESISHERTQLAQVRARADWIIDTSALKPSELKERLSEALTGRPLHKSLAVEIVAFGFKYGVPMDVDVMWDVRFLPNPFYTEELKPLTGNDPEVVEFVMERPQSGAFIDQFYELMAGLIPAYGKEGKARLTMAIGCTGGQHRSVVITNQLAEKFRRDGISVSVRHRDLPGRST